jgi:uncharacterized protein
VLVPLAGLKDDATEQQELPAGTFSSWLLEVRQAQHDDKGAVVPCGECTACCTSSQFILIRPEETDTIARIPAELLFPAPGLPTGNVVMGYDERGYCPMFIDGRCSIYEDRPRTCRAYDCRVLAATGVELDDDTKAAITARTRRWKFEYATTEDERLHTAVGAAVQFLRDRVTDFPEGTVPRNATQLAFLAIELHELFVGEGSPLVDEVVDAINQRRRD